MMTRLVLLAVIIFGPSAAATAEEVVVLVPNGSREGNWKADQGYWVRTHYPTSLQKTDEADPGFLTMRLGLVQGEPLHPGPFAVGVKELEIINQLWLVIREGGALTLRAKPELEIDHYIALVNATAALVPKMEMNTKSAVNPEREDAGCLSLHFSTTHDSQPSCRITTRCTTSVLKSSSFTAAR